MNQKNDIRKRPILVWLISAFYFVSCGWTLLSFLMITLGVIPLNDAQKMYFGNLTIIDYLFTSGIGALGVAAAISLFLMKKQAVLLFGISLALNIGTTIWQLFKTNFAAAAGTPALVGMFVGLVLIFGVLSYSKRLSKRGLLH